MAHPGELAGLSALLAPYAKLSMAGNRGGHCSKPQNFSIWSPNPPCPRTHHYEYLEHRPPPLPAIRSLTLATLTSFPEYWTLFFHRSAAPGNTSSHKWSYVPLSPQSQAQCLLDLKSLPNHDPSLRPESEESQGPAPRMALPTAWLNTLPGHLSSIPSPGAICPCPPWQKKAPGVLEQLQKVHGKRSAQAGRKSASTAHHAETWATIPGLSRCRGTSPRPLSVGSALPFPPFPALPKDCKGFSHPAPTIQPTRVFQLTVGLWQQEGLRKGSLNT